MTLTSAPAAGGTTEVLAGQVPAGYRWLVQRIAISTTSGTATTAKIYDDTAGAGSLLGLSRQGNSDYDDANVPYVVEAGKALRIVWAGCQDGAIGTARVQYQLAST